MRSSSRSSRPSSRTSSSSTASRSNGRLGNGRAARARKHGAMTRDTWIGVVFLAFAIVYWIAADGIRISPLDGPVTAAGLPKSLAYALGTLAVLLILRSLALKRAASGEPAPEIGRATCRERVCQYV